MQCNECKIDLKEVIIKQGEELEWNEFGLEPIKIDLAPSLIYQCPKCKIIYGKEEGTIVHQM